jgi:hypothetical protein
LKRPLFDRENNRFRIVMSRFQPGELLPWAEAGEGSFAEAVRGTASLVVSALFAVK